MSVPVTDVVADEFLFDLGSCPGYGNNRYVGYSSSGCLTEQSRLRALLCITVYRRQVLNSSLTKQVIPTVITQLFRQRPGLDACF